jgi:hypothetical protein
MCNACFVNSSRHSEPAPHARLDLVPQVSTSSISKSPSLRKRIVAAAAAPAPIRILPDWQLGSELTALQQLQLKFDIEVAIKVLQKYMQVGRLAKPGREVTDRHAMAAAWLLHGCSEAAAWLL